MGFLRLLGLAVAAFAVSGAEPNAVRVDHRVFPGLERMDGNWAALFAARDGKVYAGLAYHGGGGHLVYYDSKGDVVRDLGDLNVLCGESGPQSRIHAGSGEGRDGRIHSGTHAGWCRDYARFALGKPRNQYRIRGWRRRARHSERKSKLYLYYPE